MEIGVVTALDWSNSCYEGQVCDPINCIETTINNYKTEINCVLDGCSSAMSQCDTQVYVTWKGKDSEKRTCLSDNFRISGFTDFGIKSYYDAATDLSKQSYK